MTENASLPPRKTLPVVILDSMENVSEHSNVDFLLAQIDASEKNEKDILRVVSSVKKESVPVPEVRDLRDSKVFLRSGSFFRSNERCFNYDEDYFERPLYYADSSDIEWIREFNASHRYMRTNVRDLEMVFNTAEMIIRNRISDEPKLAQVMAMMPENAPPNAVVQAIFERWRAKEKQFGSAVSYREFPPDHCNLRQTAVGIHRNMNKARKQLNDVEYLRKLRKELLDIQMQKAEAVRCLNAQIEKQKQDERFVRSALRKLQKKNEIISLVCVPKPTPKKEFKEVEQQEVVTKSTLPEPANRVSFLQWCMNQVVV